jgi:hypothetical protein
MHRAAPFMRQTHEHKQYVVWIVGTLKSSTEAKYLTWLFRKTFHLGEGSFSGYHREPHGDQVTEAGKASPPRMLARGENIKDWYRFEFSGRTGELVPCSMRPGAHCPWQSPYPRQRAGIPRRPPGRFRLLKLLSEKGYVWTSFRGYSDVYRLCSGFDPGLKPLPPTRRPLRAVRPAEALRD